jgi:Uma2 family endonuclease
MVRQLKKTEIIYPDCDGNPMSDNTLQFSWIVKIKENLEILFANEPNVFIAGDLLWYPVEGDNKTRRAPDTMVAFGRAKGYRGSYQQWREDNIAPQVVFEILSPGNRLAEMTAKFEFYDRYGIEEYYIYDPDRIDFTGWVRQDSKLQGISDIAGWVSPRLGVRFELGDELEIYTPAGELFLSPVEISQKAEAAQLEATRQQARATLAESQAQLEREQAQLEREQAQLERDRANAAEQKAAIMAAKLRELGIELD